MAAAPCYSAEAAIPWRHGLVSRLQVISAVNADTDTDASHHNHDKLSHVTQSALLRISCRSPAWELGQCFYLMIQTPQPGSRVIWAWCCLKVRDREEIVVWLWEMLSAMVYAEQPPCWHSLTLVIQIISHFSWSQIRAKYEAGDCGRKCVMACTVL